MKNSVCIYIHWPWCNNICTYCDFYKFKKIKDLNFKDLYKCYTRDLQALEKYLFSNSIASIHVGGGTPSIMKSKLLVKIFEYIYKKYVIKKNVEVSIETNPEDINHQKLREYKDIGINRISLGVQSFSNHDLNFLGRAHDKKQALKSVWEASKYFSNIGIDLIYGIPALKKNSFFNQLIIAKELPIKHISIYEFNIKNREIETLENSYSLKKFSKILKTKNFFLYETNSFSIRGYESIYNKSVLGMNNYIGLGPSAHSRLLVDRRFIKYRNTKNISNWLGSQTNLYKKEIMSKKKALEEFLFLGLSKFDGVSFEHFEKLTGYAAEKYINMKNLAALKKKNLLYEKKGMIFLKEKGMLLINSILSAMLEKN